MSSALLSNNAVHEKVRVLLVDPLGSRDSILTQALDDCGYEMIDRVNNIQLMLEKAQGHCPDLIIVSMELPDEDTIEQLVSLKENYPTPVIVFSEKDTPQLVQKVVKAGVSAFIVNDVQASRLPSIINIAMARFHENQSLVKELTSTKAKLAERKTLAKAKGLIMMQKGLSEEEAYTALRKMSMDKGLSIVKVAERVIDAFTLLES